MPTCYRKIYIKETEEELVNMTRDMATEKLTDKQRLWCESFVKTHNAVLSAKKAGYSPAAAHSVSWRLRQNEDVNRYLAWLKLRIGYGAHIDAIDIIDHYARIAFADITDFVSIKANKIRLVDEDKIDGQLVKSVKQGRDGIAIELVDKLAALQKLERYFEIMPADWKEKVEQKKVEILERRMKLEEMKSGQYENEDRDDGFIAALKESAIETWSDDSEE